MNLKYKQDYYNGYHEHSCYELVYYICGSGTSWIGKKPYNFKPDTYSLIPPNVSHKEEGTQDTEVLYVGFIVSSLDKPIEGGLYKNSDSSILGELEEIKNEMINKTQFYSRIINILTEKMVIKILRNIDLSPKINDTSFEYVLNYIKLNCMKNINVKDLANSIGYSYDHFRTVFQKKYNISAKDYIIQEKYRYACDLLLNTDLSLQKIASMCSYSSPSHFGMSFKSISGLTPYDYRAKNKNSYQEAVRYNDLPPQNQFLSLIEKKKN